MDYSSIGTTSTSMCHNFHQPLTHWLSLPSTSKLVDIQVNRQRLSFTGAYWGILGQSNTTSSYRQIYISTGGCSQSVGWTKAVVWHRFPGKRHSAHSTFLFKRMCKGSNTAAYDYIYWWHQARWTTQALEPRARPCATIFTNHWLTDFPCPRPPSLLTFRSVGDA